MYASIIPENAPQPSLIKKYQTVNNSRSENGVVQACSDPNSYITSTDNYFSYNGFVSAVHCAFQNHYPLKIDPDDLWIVFLTQLSLRINENPEGFRNIFVSHEGKEMIVVRNDSLEMDNMSKKNKEYWENVFPVFEEKMNEKMKIEMNVSFSTTTIERYIVSQMTVMDAMKSYFSYKVHTCCGIPEVRIGGTKDDWVKLYGKIKELCEKVFSKEWLPGFQRFIGEAINIIDSKGNPLYWEGFYYYNGPSGGSGGDYPTTSGFINELFPLDNEGKAGKTYKDSRDTNTYPKLMSDVPFIWEYYGYEYKCTFRSGMTEVVYDLEKNQVSPKVTWQIIKNNN